MKTFQEFVADLQPVITEEMIAEAKFKSKLELWKSNKPMFDFIDKLMNTKAPDVLKTLWTSKKQNDPLTPKEAELILNFARKALGIG